jgi:hypothetical protein
MLCDFVGNVRSDPLQQQQKKEEEEEEDVTPAAHSGLRLSTLGHGAG